MACLYPGRVLIAPKNGSDGPLPVAESIGKDIGGEFSYEYGVQNILTANELKLPENFNPIRCPSLHGFPRGAEAELAQHIATLPYVAAAIPDYEVRSSSPVTFDPAALNAAIAAMGASPAVRSAAVVLSLESWIRGSTCRALPVSQSIRSNMMPWTRAAPGGHPPTATAHGTAGRPNH